MAKEKLVSGKELAKGRRLFSVYVSANNSTRFATSTVNNYIVADSSDEAFEVAYNKYKKRKEENPNIYLVGIQVSDVTMWNFSPNTIEDTEKYYEQSWEFLK